MKKNLEQKEEIGMYSDDNRFTDLEKKFLKAFAEFNIELLQECLDEGMDINANPNVNCFIEDYKWIPSSALYELYQEGNYFSKDLYLRMKKALLESGASLDGNVRVYNRWELMI